MSDTRLLERDEYMKRLVDGLAKANARVEKLEGLLNRLVAAFDDPELDTVDREGFAEEIAIEARTLLADESKENEQ